MARVLYCCSSVAVAAWLRHHAAANEVAGFILDSGRRFLWVSCYKRPSPPPCAWTVIRALYAFYLASNYKSCPQHICSEFKGNHFYKLISNVFSMHWPITAIAQYLLSFFIVSSTNIHLYFRRYFSFIRRRAQAASRCMRCAVAEVCGLVILTEALMVIYWALLQFMGKGNGLL